MPFSPYLNTAGMRHTTNSTNLSLRSVSCSVPQTRRQTLKVSRYSPPLLKQAAAVCMKEYLKRQTQILMAAAVCMKEYLKRYQSDSDAEEANKKAEKPKSSALGGLTVIDDDSVWTTKGRDSPGGEQAQAKRGKAVKRRAKKDYNSLSKEGSRSVSSSGSSPQNSGDLSPPRQRRKCLKTTSPDHHFWVGVSEESSGEKKTDRADRNFWVGLSQENSREKKVVERKKRGGTARGAFL